LDALGINLGFLLAFTINFLIVFIVLRKWVYIPILSALEKRRVTIARGLEDARVASEARENAEKEAAKITTEAQAKAGQIVREANERAEAVAREVKTEAEAEAAREREVAMAELQQERERILSDLRGQVAALSMAVAQKLIGESLDEKRQHALINEFFSGVQAGEVVVLDDMTGMAGASADVTSALPLSSEEKEVVRRDILSKIGDQATVTFRVDPSILGGLVVRVGDKVWDASVAGQMENLRQSMF
jgi:F-type H+-transporting ATPase subunit b